MFTLGEGSYLQQSLRDTYVALVIEAAAKDTKDLQATSNPPPPGLNFIASRRRDQIKQLNHCTDENKTCKASHKRHMENQILRICHHCGGHHFA